MNHFMRLGAYLFHPLLMPLFGVLIYYSTTPRFIEPEIVRVKVIAIIIITLLIPIVSFFLLKKDFFLVAC